MRREIIGSVVTFAVMALFIVPEIAHAATVDDDADDGQQMMNKLSLMPALLILIRMPR
ncbi:MAG: hypothetical protein LKF99_02295 [Bifidobacterium sp.]|nr:hypothetical protein [Bifidobacterium sp.]